MAQSNPASAGSSYSPRDRSWLLPCNRRLRNLTSISLRNLTFSLVSGVWSRGKTIDDDALPQALQSPAKRIALREQGLLGHSRSSNDLRAVREEQSGGRRHEDDLDADKLNGSNTPPRIQHAHTIVSGSLRPELTRRRRRSTLDWANAEPQTRQEKLGIMINKSLVNVFFTLHASGVEDPVYVSEVAYTTMNPTFRDIDWSSCGPGIMRLDEIDLRIWVQGNNGDAWSQMLAIGINLRQLRHLGKTVDDIHDPLPHNAILLHLADGVYTLHAWPHTKGGVSIEHAPRNKDTRSALKTRPSASFDALLRLSKLDDSIQDALAIRNQLATDLEALLQSNKEALMQRDLVAESDDRLKTIEFAKRTVEKQLEKGRRQMEEKQTSLATRRHLMASDIEHQVTERGVLTNARPELHGNHIAHDDKQRSIQDHRRRVCEDLQRCYPIQPVQGKPLVFTIRDLQLPSADDLDTESPENIAAAYGHVAHVLQLLSLYLAQPLTYPVDPRGSATTIYDPVSILKTSSSFSSQTPEQTLRTYPLFSKGVPRFRFEYAVFLINQDIRILLEDAFNLRVLDIRQTLPNLKYLLYVATAGEGELPARKAGGVRGLLRSQHQQGSESRSDSCDSASSRLSGLTLLGNGKVRGAADKLREINGKGRT